MLTVTSKEGAPMFPPLKRGTYATSRWACPWIALTFLVFAIASGIILLLRYGYPV